MAPQKHPVIAKHEKAQAAASKAQAKANLVNAKAQVARAQVEAAGYKFVYDSRTGQEKPVKS